LIVVDGKATFNLDKKTNYLVFSKYIIIVLSIIAFIVASKGFSVLYLFLLADLFCCAFVLTVFYSFYNKSINEKTAYVSIIIGLIGGLSSISFSRLFKKFISRRVNAKRIFCALCHSIIIIFIIYCCNIFACDHF
jgi:Na+/proline symporter